MDSRIEKIKKILYIKNIYDLTLEEEKILETLNSDDIKQLYLEGSKNKRIVDKNTVDKNSYIKIDSTGNVVYTAHAVMNRLVRNQLVNRDSFLMPSHSLINCIERVTDKDINDTTKLIEEIKPNNKRKNSSDSYKEPVKKINIQINSKPVLNYVKKDDVTPLFVVDDLYFIPSITNCMFKLTDDAINKLRRHSNPYINNRSIIDYSIDLRDIEDEGEKAYFKQFATIPLGLAKYVEDTYNNGNYIYLPTYCVVSSENHSYLYLNMPGGIQYVIGFGPSLVNYHNEYYDMHPGKSNRYPGRMYGVDEYYMNEIAPGNNSNWITAIGYITPEILGRIKTMLESATVIKFKTKDDCIVGGVNVCFFESTAKEPKEKNNFSYRSNFNCFGMLSYILGFILDEANYRVFYKSDDKDSPPIYLKPLPKHIINDFMESPNSKALFETIRNIQLYYTLYNYQTDIFGPPPDWSTALYSLYTKILFFFWNPKISGGKPKRNKTKRNKTKRNKTKRNKTHHQYQRQHLL